MQILHLNATYGCLRQAEWQLSPGLNLIYAPNEAGKSTWCSFIRTMLYGLPTGTRGPLADKNRYAPWSGEPMSGHMEVRHNGETWSITRETKRANAPMQQFSCYYADTAQPVPDITGQNVGQTLLGVPREVFQRSAFIGQTALRVDQDPELERRITALLTTGQEEVSYSESFERLKKQLNRRRHNKTGQLPQLERELSSLDEALSQWDALSQQTEEARLQLEQAQLRLGELTERREQWDMLEKQEALRRFREAQQRMEADEQRVRFLHENAALLPDGATLARLQGQLEALEQTQEARQQAHGQAARRQQTAQQAAYALEAHPLHPATEAQLHQRTESLTPPPAPGPFRLLLAGLLLAAAAAALLLLVEPLRWIVAAVAGCGAVGLALWELLHRRSCRKQKRELEARRAELQQQIDGYNALRTQAEQAQEAAGQAAAYAAGLAQQQQTQLLSLLSQVQVFCPEAGGPEGIRLALSDARSRRSSLEQAQVRLREQRMQCQLLQEHLPQPPLPEPEETLHRPLIGREQLEHMLPQAEEQLRLARSRLDALNGRLRAMDSRESLQAQRDRTQAELELRQAEYDALALAMTTLENANSLLQSRFSPALGAQTAEIFSELTERRYDRVLLNRELELSAQLTGDAAAHSLYLLSQGAADQLYLAVRLAICRLVLPQEYSAPLILDDALAYFDDRRLAAALEWLLRESRTRQILLFTCHRREQQLLAGRDGVHLVEWG